jgi:hypothetical protein
MTTETDRDRIELANVVLTIIMGVLKEPAGPNRDSVLADAMVYLTRLKRDIGG